MKSSYTEGAQRYLLVPSATLQRTLSTSLRKAETIGPIIWRWNAVLLGTYGQASLRSTFTDIT
jgi:hypothetical protein